MQKKDNIIDMVSKAFAEAMSAAGKLEDEARTTLTGHFKTFMRESDLTTMDEHKVLADKVAQLEKKITALEKQLNEQKPTAATPKKTARRMSAKKAAGTARKKTTSKAASTKETPEAPQKS